MNGGDLTITRMSHINNQYKSTLKISGVLPEATTCSKELYLPEYSSLEEMKNALFMVIEYGSIGFDRI